MKNYQKKLVIGISIVCIGNIVLQGVPVLAASVSKQLNVRVTKENFTEFCDSLVIQEEKQKIKLDPLYSQNFNLLTGDYDYKDMFSSRNEKYQPGVLKEIRKKQAEEYINNAGNSSGVYNINFSQQRQNYPVMNINKKTPTETNSFMYSMVANDNKNNTFDFDKTIEKVKFAISKKDFLTAENILNFTRTKSKGNNARLYLIAGFYEKINKPEEACGLYKEISDAEPANAQYIYSWALCLYKNNNDELAEKFFLKATELKPDFMNAYYNLGNLYYKKKDYYKSLDYFNRAMEINPANSDIYFNIAVTLENLDKKELAKKYYSKCLELNPQDSQAEQAIARLD